MVAAAGILFWCTKLLMFLIFWIEYKSKPVGRGMLVIHRLDFTVWSELILYYLITNLAPATISLVVLAFSGNTWRLTKTKFIFFLFVFFFGYRSWTLKQLGVQLEVNIWFWLTYFLPFKHKVEWLKYTHLRGRIQPKSGHMWKKPLHTGELSLKKNPLRLQRCLTTCRDFETCQTWWVYK